MKKNIRELIDMFNLKNDLTKNPNIWIGHAKIGYRKRPPMKVAKEILKEYFDDYIPENEPTPEDLKKTLTQWEGYHPFQKIREKDQPMFVRKEGEKIFIAVIWPWQIKKGVASLMLYEGKILE